MSPRKSEMALAKDRTSLVLNNYVQFFVGSISNKLLRASKVYNSRFGVSLNEWRTLSMLAVECGITATRICEVIGFDKAAVSRSIRILEDRGYITTRAVSTHNRARLLKLTVAGRLLHGRMMQIALQREETLLCGLSAKERRQLLTILRRMNKNVAALLGQTDSEAKQSKEIAT